VARLLDGDRHVVETLDGMIERRRAFLVDYQDEALANRYTALVEKLRTAESSVTTNHALTRAAAQAYFRLLSYKDEYEVARLHTRPEFLESLRAGYGAKARLRFHLAPPLLGGKRDARGRPLKKEFGAWILPLFRVLAKLRRLRGTAFDLFGYTAERRMERQLITEFEQAIDTVIRTLDETNHDRAIAVINGFLEIRGYGPVKDAAVVKAREEIEEALATLEQPTTKAA
jgi:indolepyruvate ferredoxin oxidoreductase